MQDLMPYAASEVVRQLDRGPYPGEDFYRLRVSGNGETKAVNITPAQLVAIAHVLGAPVEHIDPRGPGDGLGA